MKICPITGKYPCPDHTVCPDAFLPNSHPPQKREEFICVAHGICPKDNSGCRPLILEQKREECCEKHNEITCGGSGAYERPAGGFDVILSAPCCKDCPTKSLPQPKAEWVEEIIPYLRKHSSGWGFVTDESIKMFEEQFVIPTISQAIKQAREEGYQKAKSEAKKFDLAVRYGELVYEVTANGLKVKAEEEVIQQERQRVIEILEGMKKDGWTNFGKTDLSEKEQGYNQALADFIIKVKI